MLSNLVARLRPMAAELTKFVVVGGLCFVIDILLANWFHFDLKIGPTVSKTMSTIVATAVSYVLNRLWSFSHRVDDTSSQSQDLLVYGAINVAGLVITLIPIDIGHYALHDTSHLAFNVTQLIGTVVATAFRFWAYRRWVFVGETDLAEKAALV